MKLFTKTLLIAGVLVLAGCVTDQAVKDIQPVVIKDTLPQICQAAKDNRVRANDYYADKGISIVGEVMSINEYRVFMKAGEINIHAGTENQFAKQLTVGRLANVVGTITDVSYDQGCSVALKDARF